MRYGFSDSIGTEIWTTGGSFTYRRFAVENPCRFHSKSPARSNSFNASFTVSRVWGRHSLTSICPGWKMKRDRNLGPWTILSLTSTSLQLFKILRKSKKRRTLSLSWIRRFHMAKILLFHFSFVILCHEFYRVLRHIKFFGYFFYGFFINTVILENKRRHLTCLCNQCPDQIPHQ